MGRENLASLPLTWDQSLQPLPAARRSGSVLSLGVMPTESTVEEAAGSRKDMTPG